MGHGEELTLRFPVDDFGPVPSGSRSHVSFQDGQLLQGHGSLYGLSHAPWSRCRFTAMSGYPYGPSEHYPERRRPASTAGSTTRGLCWRTTSHVREPMSTMERYYAAACQIDLPNPKHRDEIAARVKQHAGHDRVRGHRLRAVSRRATGGVPRVRSRGADLSRRSKN